MKASNITLTSLFAVPLVALARELCPQTLLLQKKPFVLPNHRIVCDATTICTKGCQVGIFTAKFQEFGLI